jgi:hypothetical protein
VHHSLGIKEGAIQGNAETHHIDEAIPAAVEQGKNEHLQFVVERKYVLLSVALSACSRSVLADGPAKTLNR